MKKFLKKFKKINSWIKAIIIAVITIAIINTFVFESFIQKNDTMENTILEGDFVIINKLSYGARIPMTMLSIPFTNIYSELVSLPYIRIPGFTEIKNNDLIAFNYPYQNDIPIDKKTIYIKRCFGTPGDIIEIIDKVVYINENLADSLKDIKYQYRFTAKKYPLNIDFFNFHEINSWDTISDKGLYEAFLNRSQAKAIEKDSLIINLRILKDLRAEKVTGIFPQSPYVRWNKDYFGPLRIPKENDTIYLNKQNYDIYKKLISVYENNNLYFDNENFYINDIKTNKYVVKYNYYFVIDDNRDNYKDSRKWGFLPENHIVGKASFIWFSISNNNEDSFRFSRIFKSLN